MVASRTEKSALDWLRERRQKDGSHMISDIEFQAGDRIRRDFWLGQMAQRVTTNYQSVPKVGRFNNGRDSSVDFRQSVLDARERVRRALEAVGSDYSGLIMDICCLDRKLSDVEVDSGWPKRSGKVILQLALRQLARHYGLLQDRSDRVGNVQPKRHWGDQDYRPVLSASYDDANSQD
ncbi:MAG: DUF6456 domain-containing protein [Pseudomonadota bacterium]